jgi:hypothetical protein
MFRASTIAPRTELFIKFACDELRPEYRVDATRWINTTENADTSNKLELTITYLPQPVKGEKGDANQRGQLPMDEKAPMKTTLLHPDKRCVQDKEVHRAAAKLSAAITSAQGMLSCLTTGWWTQVCRISSVSAKMLID